MFFNDWHSLVRILVVGIPVYVGLVAFLRISGKRTLSKMNAFDLIVTVALGSTLASTLLSKDVALAEGLLALFLLIALQFVITWSAVRSDRFQRLIKARARLLAFDGKPDKEALRQERVTMEELTAAVRDQGMSGVAAAYAVILETDGSLAVIPRQEGLDSYGALEYVEGAPRGAADGA